MRLLLRDTQLGEPVQDLVSLDFQLPCQLVDSNLLHRKAICSYRAGAPSHAPGALVRGVSFRARSFRLIVSGGTRVFYRTKLFRCAASSAPACGSAPAGSASAGATASASVPSTTSGAALVSAAMAGSAPPAQPLLLRRRAPLRLARRLAPPPTGLRPPPPALRTGCSRR